MLVARPHQDSAGTTGRSFPFAFAPAVQALGIRHQYIKPAARNRTARSNGVTGSTKKEFWGRRRFDDFDAAAVGLRAWERRYNHERFSMAFQGRTPAKKHTSLITAVAV